MTSISPADIVIQRFNQIVVSVTDNIQCCCADPARDFTRKRKLSASELIKFIICSESKSIPSELCSFFSENVPSSSAFCQQRAKLLPEALRRVFLQTAAACRVLYTCKADGHFSGAVKISLRIPDSKA